MKPVHHRVGAFSYRVAALVVVSSLVLGACSNSDDGPSAPSASVASSTDGGSSTTTSTSLPRASTVTVTVTAEQLCRDAGLVESGPITEGELNEISGLVASRDQAAVLWVHNDSGHPGEVWAIDHAGAVLSRFDVDGATSVDWEDIAIGAGPAEGESYLYVGDIGDNSFTPVIGRGTEPRTPGDDPVVVYRIPEPAVLDPPADGSTGDDAAFDGTTETAVAFAVEYADGPRDAEALLADPVTGDVFVISKQWRGGPASLYRLPSDIVVADAASGEAITMERVTEVSSDFGGLVTGADISADGTLVAVRSYGSVALWGRDLDATVAETLAQPPTCARSVGEPQGEAVAFGPESDSLVTISEGDEVPLNWFRLPAS